MFHRALSALLFTYHASTGAWILVDPRGWLSFVIAHEVTGALPGQHFMYDVGLAFIASSVGFLLYALQPKHWTGAAIGAAFPLLHALMHLKDMLSGDHGRLVFEAAAIVAPAVLGVLVAWPPKRA